ncbi:50S ribosomal protein L33 [Mycobacterium tuberculosis]|nr:50S ribosomal protein L33 [Mycobacterium tuberculosis]
MRVNITLEHKESGERLYLTSKNKRNTPDLLQLKKYSPKLRKHSLNFDETTGDYSRSHRVSLKGYYKGRKIAKAASAE